MRFGNKNEKMKQKKSTRKMDIASMKAEDHKRMSRCVCFKTLVKTRFSLLLFFFIREKLGRVYGSVGHVGFT